MGKGLGHHFPGRMVIKVMAKTGKVWPEWEQQKTMGREGEKGTGWSTSFLKKFMCTEDVKQEETLWSDHLTGVNFILGREG